MQWHVVEVLGGNSIGGRKEFWPNRPPCRPRVYRRPRDGSVLESESMVSHEHGPDRNVDGVARPDETRGLPEHGRPLGYGACLQELAHTTRVVDRRVSRSKDVQNVLQFPGTRCDGEAVTDGEEIYAIKGAPQILCQETKPSLRFGRV